jgi:hypothetical protein
VAAPEITRERLTFSQTRRVKWRFRSKKFDRFKRLYVVWLDRNNSEPTGQIERAFNIPMTDAGPLDIPDHFLRFPEEEPWKVVTLFNEYARYLKNALREWELRLEQFIADSARGEPIEKAHRKAGAKPLDWRLIMLMARGDPWCLGFTAKRTPAVEAIIGKAKTARELKLAEAAGPKDLQLDPELEALLHGGQSVMSGFPDDADAPITRERITSRFAPLEDDDEDAPLIPEQRLPRKLRDDDDEPYEPDDAEMAAFLKSQTGASDDDDSDDEEEGVLTGDLDLDTEPRFPDDSLELAEEMEERVDPKASGGKRTDPKKNRTKPTKE